MFAQHLRFNFERETRALQGSLGLVVVGATSVGDTEFLIRKNAAAAPEADVTTQQFALRTYYLCKY